MADEVLSVMEEVDEPFMTLKEITAEVDVTKKTVQRRMEELVEDGEVNRKKVGSRAVVWWLPEKYQGNQASD